MRPTSEFLYSKFDEYNRIMFCNRLLPVKIVINNAGTVLGVMRTCVRKHLLKRAEVTYSIHISRRYDLPTQTIEDILIHEMIHYAIALSGEQDNAVHGNIFKAYMRRINMDFGRNISVKQKLSEEAMRSDLHVVKHYIIVSYMKGGQKCITRCASTRVGHIYKALQCSGIVDNAEVYVTANSYFNRYPNSRSAKLYKISDRDLNKELFEMGTRLN